MRPLLKNIPEAPFFTTVSQNLYHLSHIASKYMFKRIYYETYDFCTGRGFNINSLTKKVHSPKHSCLQALSVIAHQIQSIQRAIQAKMPSMIFEDSDIKIDPGCAILVTTESLQTESKHLPDNLKVLFRPVAMANPDFSLIAELVLCSQGFDEARVLAKKLAGWIIRTQNYVFNKGPYIF